jgi:hypothetical protein
MATTTATSIAAAASSSVAGMRSTICRSPEAGPERRAEIAAHDAAQEVPYCSSSGRSRPSFCRSSSTSFCDAASPSIACAGSPGIR